MRVFADLYSCPLILLESGYDYFLNIAEACALLPPFIAATEALVEGPVPFHASTAELW